MCQVFSHVSAILHHFVLAKLAASSLSVKSVRLGVRETLPTSPV